MGRPNSPPGRPARWAGGARAALVGAAAAAGLVGALGALLLVPGWRAADAAAPAAAQLYQTRCAACHDRAFGRAPSRAALAHEPTARILGAITDGAMQEFAAGLPPAERLSLARYLSQVRGPRGGSGPLPCGRPPPPVRLGGPGWNGWGGAPSQTRFQPRPGLGRRDLARLRVQWALPLSGARTGEPVVVDGRVFIDDTSGAVYALDARTGCAYWRYQADAGARNTISLAPAPGRPGEPSDVAAYFVDGLGQLVRLDARTGRPVWKRRVGEQASQLFTGSLLAAGGRLYVPVSSTEEGLAASGTYACCRFRGAVVAFDAASGRRLWTTYTTPIAPAPYRRKPGGGWLWGPAGAAVWSAPTLDAARGLLYVATGNSYTDRPNPGADAVIAMDLATGAVRWTRQLTPGDDFVMGCGAKPPGPANANCPRPASRDGDFGMSPLLRRAGGRNLILVGQKSGVVYALNADRRGEVVWTRRLSAGGELGGVQFGGAADPERLYVGVSDHGLGADARPGVTALDLADGRVAWTAPSARAACRWRNAYCDPAVSMALTAMPGAVLAGAMNGRLRAYDARSGAVLWSLDAGATAFPVPGGRRALGGSFDGSGPVIAEGMVFVPSGYGSRSDPPGVLLLALAPEGGEPDRTSRQ